MSTSTDQIDIENEALLKRIAGRTAPKEHLEYILATTPPFDYGAWVEEADLPYRRNWPRWKNCSLSARLSASAP
jgi:hypothetical protein